MKDNKPENQKKESRKAAKKALEQSLTTKLIEAVKSLGHDAEKIGADLVLVSKFMAKKISKRVKESNKETKVAPVAVTEKKVATKPAIPAKTAKVATAKSEEPKAEPVKAKPDNPVVKSNKTAKTAVKKSKPASSTDKEQLN